jgi:hypothetical protein
MIRKLLIGSFMLLALLTACSGQEPQTFEADTGLTVTVYYSPT